MKKFFIILFSLFIILFLPVKTCGFFAVPNDDKTIKSMPFVSKGQEENTDYSNNLGVYLLPSQIQLSEDFSQENFSGNSDENPLLASNENPSQRGSSLLKIIIFGILAFVIILFLIFIFVALFKRKTV